MKKKLSILMALLMMFSVFTVKPFASNEFENVSSHNNDEWYDWYKSLSPDEQRAVNYNTRKYENKLSIKEDFNSSFEFSKAQKIRIGGVENPLLQEFKSQEDSLDTVKQKCKTLIGNLQKYYKLEDLREDNWEEYEEVLYSSLDEKEYNHIFNEENYEFRFLRSFFDIFENKYKNDKVKDLVSTLEAGSNTINGKEAELIIAKNLPYFAPFAEQVFDSCMSGNSLETDKELKDEYYPDARVAISNLDAAIIYAGKYAKTPNIDSYHYFRRGDCTNFVSQILEAGGVRQEVYDSEYLGWWHKYNPKAWWGKHTHSRSWTMADTFARYMGVILTRTNHRNFSANVHKGTIIAGDFQDDGDWDYTAFVTAADSYAGNYGGMKYYDYKVAQHTGNYHEWTSSNANNWEYIGLDGGRYGRIRH